MFSKDSLPVPEHIWTPWSDMISLYSTHFNTGSGGYPNHIESPAGNSHIRFFQQAWRPRDEIREDLQVEVPSEERINMDQPYAMRILMAL